MSKYKQRKLTKCAVEVTKLILEFCKENPEFPAPTCAKEVFLWFDLIREINNGALKKLGF